MDVIAAADVETTEALDGVRLAQLLSGERMNIQHFTIEPGAAVGEHHHDAEQAGQLFAGELTWVVDGASYVTEAGDSYIIPGNAVHAVENTGDETAVGIDIFSPPRANPDWAE
jgi:quercetin dioxygenase-like cupin family protein